MKFRELSKNGLGSEARPYLIADTSNGLATHRCGVAFGNPTGGQGWPHIGGGALTLEDAEAYARLFAAAPDLLMACKAVLAAMESADLGGEVLWIGSPYQAAAVHETAVERLQYAIAKAYR